MELTVDRALQQAVAAHQEGKLQDAERLYRAILQANPKHPDANHNLGVLAVAVGKPLEALPLFQQALDANPKVEQFWLSYIDVLIRLERFDEANRVLVEGEKAGVSSGKLDALKPRLRGRVTNNSEKAAKGLMLSEIRKKIAERKKAKKTKARSSSPRAEPSQDQIGRLLVHYQAGRLEEAEELATLFTQQFPKHPFGWKALGVIFKQTGRLNEALLHMQESVGLSPQDAEAQYNLGNTLKKLGKLDDAEASYGQAIALKPDYAEAHNNLSNMLRELGRLDEAEASCRKAITLKPDYAEAHNNLGNTLRALGRLDDAEASYQQAIATNPDYAEAHKNLGNTLRELGRLDEAEASFEQAIALKPDYAEVHRDLATMKKFSSKDEQWLPMLALYHDPATSEENRCHICFALAKAYEDLREFARAFQFYAEGNALRKKELGYNKAQDKQLFESLKANYQQIGDLVEPEIVAPEIVPIFIVGMPRSGTTLVEQIISSHPLVTGAGELSFATQFGSSLAVGHPPVSAAALATFREEYLNALKRRSEGNAIVTDKMPQNFCFLGLITAAFPEAKIIHVKRDPAAVCWANYTQYFVANSLGYCYGLDDILHYHELYQDLMSFWHQAFPKRIYDLDYEVLTEHQEEMTRKLVGHLELNWDDACLSPQENARGVATASNAQVRKKVYRGSSELWRRYRPFLNGALDHLSVSNQ